MNRRGFLGLLGALVPLAGAVKTLSPTYTGIDLASGSDFIGFYAVTPGDSTSFILTTPFGTPEALARAVDEALMRRLRSAGTRF